MTKRDILSELLAIQEHRRKTWKREWGKADTFVNFEENAKYKRVSRLIAFLSVMTEAEYADISKRADQSVADKQVEQQSLF